MSHSRLRPIAGAARADAALALGQQHRAAAAALRASCSSSWARAAVE
jgi:hypothetical protein